MSPCGRKGLMQEGGKKEYKPEIYEGLQIPSSAARPIRSKVKTVTLKPVLTNDEVAAKEGSYCTDKDASTIYDEDVDV